MQRIEDEKQQQQLKEKISEEKSERLKRVRSECIIYMESHSETKHTKINADRGVKGNTTYSTINVTHIYAYCPKDMLPTTLSQDIKDIIFDTNLRIYIYDSKYTVEEIKKGQIDGHYKFSYVRDHCVYKNFFD